jgi:hypothetical protein
VVIQATFSILKHHQTDTPLGVSVRLRKRLELRQHGAVQTPASDYALVCCADSPHRAETPQPIGCGSNKGAIERSANTDTASQVNGCLRKHTN